MTDSDRKSHALNRSKSIGDLGSSIMENRTPVGLDG